MKVTFSLVRHIPIVEQWGNEYYPWQLHHLAIKGVRFYARLLRAHMVGINLTAPRTAAIREEWDMWNQCYKPSLQTLPDHMILDAGSGEGETLLFYYLLGFRRFRLVETDAAAFSVLRRNVERIPSARCELLNRSLRTQDLQGVKFAKIDVEGGETELLNATRESLPEEMVIETHGKETRERLQAHLGSMMFRHQLSKEPEVILWRWINNSQLKRDASMVK